MEWIIPAFAGLLLLAFVLTYLLDKSGIGERTAQLYAQRRQQIAFQQAEAYYPVVAQVVIRCVGNNYIACGLRKPSALPQHVPPNRKHIVYDLSKGVIYQFVFDRQILSFGSDGIRYSSVFEPSKVARLLNCTMSNYALANGLEPLKVCVCRPINEGRVVIGVRFTNGGV